VLLRRDDIQKEARGCVTGANFVLDSSKGLKGGEKRGGSVACQGADQTDVGAGGEEITPAGGTFGAKRDRVLEAKNDSPPFKTSHRTLVGGLPQGDLQVRDWKEGHIHH